MSELNASQTIETQTSKLARFFTPARRKSIIAFCLSVIAAILIWFFVSSAEVEVEGTPFIDVPVAFLNINYLRDQYQLSVISGEGIAVDVTLRGPRAMLSRINSQDIRVYIDLANYTEAGTHHMELNVQAPFGTTALFVTPNFINVTLDRTVNRTVLLEDPVPDITILEGYSIESIVARHNNNIIRNLTVMGPELEINRIHRARLNLDPMGVVTESRTLQLSRSSIVLYDVNDQPIAMTHLSIQGIDTLHVDINVVLERIIPLGVAFEHGLFNSGNAVITLEPPAITVRGEPALIRAMGEEFFVYMLDEKLIGSNRTVFRQLNLPSGVALSDPGTVQNVAIEIDLRNSRRIVTVPSSNFIIINPNNLSYQIIDNAIAVTIRADNAIVNQISANDIFLTIDLTYVEESGEVILAAQVTFSAEFGDRVYEIRENIAYEIRVLILE